MGVSIADPFHSLDNLKNESASVSFCRSSRACSDRSGAVTESPIVYTREKIQVVLDL